MQYRLLKHGIDSARLTTDSGLDLVVYTPARGALTVQVKTSERPGPAGGRGALALGWTFNPDCGADLMAFVDLSTDSVWVFTMEEATDTARQTLPLRHRLYWHLNPSPGLSAEALIQADMDRYRIENRISELFGDHADTTR